MDHLHALLAVLIVGTGDAREVAPNARQRQRWRWCRRGLQDEGRLIHTSIIAFAIPPLVASWVVFVSLALVRWSLAGRGSGLILGRLSLFASLLFVAGCYTDSIIVVLVVTVVVYVGNIGNEKSTAVLKEIGPEFFTRGKRY